MTGREFCRLHDPPGQTLPQFKSTGWRGRSFADGVTIDRGSRVAGRLDVKDLDRVRDAGVVFGIDANDQPAFGDARLLQVFAKLHQV